MLPSSPAGLLPTWGGIDAKADESVVVKRGGTRRVCRHGVLEARPPASNPLINFLLLFFSKVPSTQHPPETKSLWHDITSQAEQNGTLSQTSGFFQVRHWQWIAMMVRECLAPPRSPAQSRQPTRQANIASRICSTLAKDHRPWGGRRRR